MKLKVDAVAVLTLGPRMTKDKLMQGAGRMRQLSSGQRLFMVATTEIRIKINGGSNSPIMVSDILKWVMGSTESVITEGLSQWTHNGIIHCKQELSIKEDWTLETLYASESVPVTLMRMIQDAKCNSSLGDDIYRHVERFGDGIQVKSSAANEECEREMQLECEVYQEKEIEIPIQVALSETKWDYSSVLCAVGVKHLPVSCYTLKNTVKFLLGKESGLNRVLWSLGKVFATSNFRNTIKSKENMNMGNFLGVVNEVLQFANNDLLLLSGMEANGIIKILWSNPNSKNVRLISLPRFTLPQSESELLCVGGLSLNPTKSSIVVAQLFNGETMYDGIGELDLLEQIVIPESRKSISELISFRGRLDEFGLSDLERICTMF